MAQAQREIDQKILERGYWIATHRLSIKKWTMIGLYIVIVFVYLLFFTQFGVYMFRYSDWQELIGTSVRPLYSWQQISTDTAPLEIEVGPPALFSMGDNRYDIVAEVYNPNTQWALESINYSVMAGEREIAEGVTFILPGERKFLTVLGYTSETPLTEIDSFVLSDLSWRNISRLPELSWFYPEPPQFIPRQIVTQQGKQTVIPARVKWSVQNQSTLNIRRVIWQISLYNNDRLAGIIDYQAEDFPFLGVRDFDIFVTSPLPRIDEVQVDTIIDIFNPDFTYLR